MSNTGHTPAPISSSAAPSTNDSAPQPTSRRLNVAFGVAVAMGVVAIYVLSLLGVHLLAKSAPVLPAVDLSKFEAEDTVVQIRVEKLDTVANRLTVNVLVIPKDSLIEKDSGVLKADAAVRMYPQNELGNLQYPKGKAPAQVSTVIEAQGEPGDWPFDSYKTEMISADVFTGAGPTREKVSAHIEVSGKLDGWDATVARSHDPDDPNPDTQDDVTLTLHRSKGTLIFDLGICLVLIALPVLALWVAIPVALGRTSFLPPMVTWYAAMLFAIVPLRNVLPGSPPFGSWIDQAVVLWVLIGLVTAMAMFLFGWWRQRDRKKKPT